MTGKYFIIKDINQSPEERIKTTNPLWLFSLDMMGIRSNKLNNKK